jgi:2-polyprenyl-6-hydroxyphenyl methylase / 3-demethylubiquinone-9 3-methyltransferase
MADQRMPGSADRRELERFERLANDWWDETGALAALHKLNPVRLTYIRDRLCAHLGRDPARPEALEGLAVLDVGCGGGILCEPLARLGAEVTGIDLVPANLAVARQHARVARLDVSYRETSVEEIAAAGERFDLVCAMEVVEHVSDVPGFLASCAEVVRPSGALVLATLNRTLRSFALGIVAAEYILGWVPRGTHQWTRFLRPSKVARALRQNRLRMVHLTGVTYDPLRDRFRLSPDPAVNYMLFAVRD